MPGDDRVGELNAEVRRLAAQARKLKGTNALMQEFFRAVRDEHKRACRTGDRAALERIRSSAAYARAFRADEPLVSVIIPTLHRARLILERALPSVMRQDYRNWELIIVGDAMAEEQAAFLRAFRDPRVRFYNLRTRGRYPQPQGPRWCVAGIKPMNFGLRVARGDWISHLDDDDEYSIDHISVLLAAARERQAEWAHGKVLFVEEGGGPGIALGDAQPKFGRISRISSLYVGPLKTFRYHIGCWRYFYPGDWDLWERFLDMGVSHVHVDSIVGTHYNAKAAAAEAYAVAPAAAPLLESDKRRRSGFLARWWGRRGA